MPTIRKFPKPEFASCDETSLKLKTSIDVSGQETLYIQYKLPHQDWSVAKEAHVEKSDIVYLASIVDLEPGTAYSVRFCVKNITNGSELYGEETVFDTKPIDCTPKKKSCVIS